MTISGQLEIDYFDETALIVNGHEIYFNTDIININDQLDDNNPSYINFKNLVLRSNYLSNDVGLTISGNIVIENNFQNIYDYLPITTIGTTAYANLCSDSGGNMHYLPSLPKSTVDCLFLGQDHATPLDTSCNIVISSGLVTIEWTYGFQLFLNSINTSNESAFYAVIPLANAYPIQPNNGDRKLTSGQCVCNLWYNDTTLFKSYTCNFSVGYDQATSQGILHMNITDQTTNPITRVNFLYNSNTNYFYTFGDAYSQAGFTISYMI